MEYLPTEKDWDELIDLVNKLPSYASDTPLTESVALFRHDLEPILIAKVRELDPLIAKLEKQDLLDIVQGRALLLAKRELAAIEAAYFALKEPEKAAAYENRKRAVKSIPIESLIKCERKSSQRYLAICIFHEENTPSMTIYTESNTFFCFGCHKFGDAIDILRERDTLSFAEVLKKYG